MNDSFNAKLVFVTGDQTVDWAVLPSSKYSSRNIDERLHVSVRLCWHKGGIFLLKYMIKDALGSRSAPTCAAKDPEPSRLSPYESGYNYSFAVFRKFHKRDNSHSENYRVDQYLGFRKNRDHHNVEFETGGLEKCKVLVIDDAALDFRKRRDHWLSLLPKREDPGEKPWVVLKMSHEIASGEFWEWLHKRLVNPRDWIREKLIVTTSVARLRDKGAEISRDLSWQRSAYDVLTEFSRPALSDLLDCPRLAISFGPSGALLIDKSGDSAIRQLIYNHEVMEGDWLRNHGDGMMFGYGSVLCASIVSELVACERCSPDLTAAVRRGLAAMQRLYDRGFTVKGRRNHPPEGEFTSPSVFSGEIEDHYVFSTVDLPRDPQHDMKECENLPIPGDLNDRNSPLFDIACRGKPALDSHLAKTPVAMVGDLLTADQEEIEGLHSICNIVGTYCSRGRDLLKSKPLAVAVFGAPGSGKGYTVEQLAKQWSDKDVIRPLTFNLSQFSSPRELVGALHQIRDVALAGKVPLAMWDEFDSSLDGTPLGWLRYFLGPIQDGKFQQEDTIHLIGPSIFMFAGGTSHSYEEFSNKVSDAGPETKASDFLSRLRGFIDIAGIDSEMRGQRPSKQVMLRRVLLLNSLFRKYEVAKDENNAYMVDPGILHAFLEVPEYEHGARSVEAIIQMSRRGMGDPFERIALPSLAQLNMHVGGNAFLKAMREHRDASA
ncbi:hypothetical protein QBA35_23985 [Streptomyces bottropensis]|uniref:ATPase AAA-type core domain-containing protein n=1 Tax=Streptomyces bottropensis TaxID=42235 RepID=A0ABU8AST7_9ACTN